MGQLPAIFRELNNPDSPLHIGAILDGFEPLCKKLPDSEMDLIGWVSSRGWNPNAKYCLECAKLYKEGVAWKPPSARA